MNKNFSKKRKMLAETSRPYTRRSIMKWFNMTSSNTIKSNVILSYTIRLITIRLDKISLNTGVFIYTIPYA